MKKLFLLFFLLFFTSCDKKNYTPMSKTEILLGTVINITIYDSDDKKILQEAIDLVRHYENLFSQTIQTSDIYKLNNANGLPVEVDKKTIDVIKKSIEYSIISDGKFDITIGTISSLWDFTQKKIKPDDKIIKNNLENISYENILIKDNTVSLNPNTKIDLGGIAKGYIADEIKSFLISKNITSAIINLGGNVLLVGNKYYDNLPFAVGIQKPFVDHNIDIGKVDVSDKSIVTSGIYERYFYIGDEFYHHILDPKTGYPVSNDLSSITIISDKSIDGDALSTLCFTLGTKDAIDFINTLDNVDAIAINKDDKIYYSDGIGTEISFKLF